ncbi:MAG: LysR family transcriptional regulator [Clostridia bacterium]|nr:LysR family transcriptional regulator [Clostridia bacterium]
MNTRQLQYAIELSKCLNFSQVAEQLGITQPALSKQILNLENELGVKLFDRNTVPLTVTPAGEHFFQEAEKLLYQEDQLIKSMEEFKSGKRGRLVIGISPFRSLYLIPKIAKKIQQKYPYVQITLQEAGSDQLRKETAEGKYDLAVVNLPVDESVLDITPIEPDTLVLAVPKSMSADLPTVPGERLPQIDLKDCKHLPFVSVSRAQEMRQLLEKSCAAADFSPNVTMEVVGISTACAMCLEGIGATLLPLQFVEHIKTPNTVDLFTLKHSVYSRQPVIITRRGQYISEYAKYAIDLLTKQI